MVRKIGIPEPVKDSIKEHINKSVERAIKGFESAFEDEDVLTGVLFGLLKIGQQRVEVPDQGTWRWSIDFKKFGGRGRLATESILGADGIFDLLVSFGTKEVAKKSLLFQSKLGWKNKDDKLYRQCGKMLPWLGAATIINYTQDQFETYTLDGVMASHGSKPLIKKPLEILLGEDFLNCNIGDLDLEYDGQKKQLIWLDVNNDFVATKFNLNRRLRVTIKAPEYHHKREIKKFIPFNELHKHRMKNDLALMPLEDATSISEVDKARNNLSKIFHPDKHNSLPPPQVEMLDDLMKNINMRVDERRKQLRSNKH